MPKEGNPWYACYAILKKQGNSRVFFVSEYTTQKDLENEVIWELMFRRKTVLSKEVQDAILVSQAEKALVSARTKQNLAYQLVCTKNNIPENYYPDVIIKNLGKHNKLIQLFRTPYIVQKEKYEQYIITKNKDIVNPITEQGLLDNIKYWREQVEQYKNSNVLQSKKDELLDAVKQLDEYVVKKNLWIWAKISENFKTDISEIGANAKDVELALYDLAHDITLHFVQDRVTEITKVVSVKSYYESINKKRQEKE